MRELNLNEIEAINGGYPPAVSLPTLYPDKDVQQLFNATNGYSRDAYSS